MSRAVDRVLRDGQAARARGDLDGAARLVGRAFARAQRSGDEAGMARALVEVALVALDGDDADTAARALGQVLALVDADREPATATAAVLATARLAGALDDPETAVRLHAGSAVLAGDDAARAVREGLGAEVLAQVSGRLSPEQVATLTTDGAALRGDSVLALAAARADA